MIRRPSRGGFTPRIKHPPPPPLPKWGGGGGAWHLLTEDDRVIDLEQEGGILLEEN